MGRGMAFRQHRVANLTRNVTADGTSHQNLELRSHNENYLNDLDAKRITGRTTAGDFLRRFDAADLDTLMRVLNDKRVGVWQQQPADFLAHAIIEADGTLVGTTGQCKAGMDLPYNGVWGYPPLLGSLSNPNEPLF